MCTHDDADIATAASHGRVFCCMPRSATASTCRKASWWGTVTATSRQDDSAGCRTILIGDGYGETFKAQPDATVSTLSEAADWILKQPVTKD